MTKETKTYYVNISNGLDSNDGKQNAPFKTIQNALNLIPQVVNDNIIINVDGINYAERFNVKGFTGYGKISILGASKSTCKINFIAASSVKCELDISNINISNDTGINTLIVNSDYVKINNCEYTTSANQTGIQANNSNLEINSCDISNKSNSIVADRGSTIMSINNTGTNNTNVFHASNGAVISKNGTVPSGTVAETIENGGVIR